MKKTFKVTSVLAGIVVLVIAVVALLTPWMDRWGATDAEVAASLPGDKLVPAPIYYYNRAITIKAAPEQIYPWLLQMGAGTRRTI